MQEIYIDIETQKIVRVVDDGAYILSLLFGSLYFLIKKCYLLAAVIFIASCSALAAGNSTIYLLISIFSCIFSKYLIKKSWEDQGFIKYENNKQSTNVDSSEKDNVENN